MDLFLAVSLQIALHAARYDSIHHQAVTEASVRHAQDLLAQVSALRMHHGEGGIVTDGTDVAEVIGEPFQLGHERAQPKSAAWHLDAECRLDRPGER